MANHDDLDLISLFGLSHEEANGLGLDAAGRLPADAEDELPRHAEPVSHEDEPVAQPAQPIRLVGPTAAGRRDDLLADELALFAMLDSDETDAASYDGHDAPRGLALAAHAEPLPRPASAQAPRDLDPAAVSPSQLEQAPAYDPAAADDEGRFIIPTAQDDPDDDMDLVRLFGLSTEEASGLGIETSHLPTHGADCSLGSAEPAAQRASPSSGERQFGSVTPSGEGEQVDSSLPHAEEGLGVRGDAATFPTMYLHAIENNGADDDPAAGFFIVDESRDAGELAAESTPRLTAEAAEVSSAEMPDEAINEPLAPHRYSAEIESDTERYAESEADAIGAEFTAAPIVPATEQPDDRHGEAVPMAEAEVAAWAEPAPLQPDGADIRWAEEPAATIAAEIWGDTPTAAWGGTPAMAGNDAADETPAAYGPPTVDPDLLDAFAEESAELLDGLHLELERLEGDVDDHGALLETRRLVHTLKGGAKMCSFEVVATLAHSCENLLDLIADGAAMLDAPALHALFDCEPLLRAAVQDAIAGQAADTRGPNELAARFDALCTAAGTTISEPATGGEEPSTDDVAPAAADPATAEEIDAPSLHDLSPVAQYDAAPAMPEFDHGGDVAGDVADTLDHAIEHAAGIIPPDTAHAETATNRAPRSPAAELWRPASLAASAGSADAATPEQRPAGRRGAHSINVDLNKVDTVVAKVTEMAAHRASSQGMIGQLMETSQEARRNVTRLHNLVMQIGNECAGMQPEPSSDDDLNLESYNALNTLIIQLQEAVSDQQALIQSVHDTLTSHWGLQASETRVDADIQSALMSIRLVPIANMRVRLDGVVRQAAEATGKQVRWQLQGGNVAVEKNVFDRLFEPLMHLLRNAIDHGIEAPAVRREAGKPENGAITVGASQEGNQIVIAISDDGDGIVPNRIATLAVERGIVTAEQANGMSHQQKIGLIFTPGFSTADKVSHISGRGVGMDAVREACLRMGGSIDVTSRPGVGTTFTMRLPLSLSVTRGLIVRDGGCLMVLPVAQVVALHLVAADDVTETPRGRIARIEGQELPIYNLPPLPGAVPASYVQNGEVNVLQVAHEGGSIGLLIEDVLGEEEVLIKAPPALLRGVKTLLGAYVLPDGRVAPVVNLPQMLIDLRTVTTLAAPRDEGKAAELRALVVDDSMSMRVALSGTLQSAGFNVLTARDGQEALDLLKREGLPSLVTLDVEMPRMDGLETLFAIRQMPGAHGLPVFMMTSRGGAKHRRAAEQLGATRYFTKPYRDSELASAAREVCADAISA